MKKNKLKKIQKEFTSDLLLDDSIRKMQDNLLALRKNLLDELKKHKLDNKIDTIDQLYSITIQITDRSIRLIATVIKLEGNEEIEKKIALINLNIDEQNSLKHNELIKIRRIFYSYRHLLLCLEFLNPDL